MRGLIWMGLQGAAHVTLCQTPRRDARNLSSGPGNHDCGDATVRMTGWPAYK